MKLKFKTSNFPFPNRDEHPRELLLLHHGSLENAARIMDMSIYKLSRIVNGKPHELEDHLKILVACKLIPADHIMPRMDMETFLLLNKEILNNRQKALLRTKYA